MKIYYKVDDKYIDKSYVIEFITDKEQSPATNYLKNVINECSPSNIIEFEAFGSILQSFRDL